MKKKESKKKTGEFFRITITDKEGKRESFKVHGYLAILVDADGEKGIKFKSSSDSIPRRMGWVEWARQDLIWCANSRFCEHYMSGVRKIGKKIKNKKKGTKQCQKQR